MIKIATANFPVGKKKYESSLKTVELDSLFTRFPKIETIQKWRQGAPDQFDFITCASRIITYPTKTRAQHSRHEQKNQTSLEDSALTRQATERTLKIAEILRSRLVFFDFPSSFLPSPENIKRIQNYFSKPRGHILFTWEPPVSWPLKLVDDLSEAYRIMPVMNPLGKAKPTPHSPMRYYRLGGHGKTSGTGPLSDNDLKKIISLCDTPLCYVVFNNGPTAFDDALRMMSMLNPKQLP
ncbi:MAG: hypothetical protein KCHDKBKB_00048 [Elusimicrobia bacterium]|nr:hypothetical protein [Elusimicrobiota bacterium]